MAITRTITEAPVLEEERTWRANIETPSDGDYRIEVYREVVQKDANGTVVGAAARATRPVERAASAIAGESVTVGGQSVTATLILAALPLFFDRWAQEDSAARKHGEPS